MSGECDKCKDHCLKCICNDENSAEINQPFPDIECKCVRCQSMCHAPCCGTPEDIENLIKNGYASRLMLDDWQTSDCNADIIKPALKGSELQLAPWEVSSIAGCTFWKNGLCELHDSGLKPCQGKMALHEMTEKEGDQIGAYIKRSWETEKAKEVINLWKEVVNFREE